jgi:DNA polymerase III sliding clamp (beta) subunit (PCNA family)
MRKQDIKTALAFASKDISRAGIHGVRVEPGRLIATNGHMLVIVHESLERAPRSEAGFAVRFASMKTVLDKTGRDEAVTFTESGADVAGVTHPVDLIPGGYPDYPQVLPEAGKGVTVRLDPHYLKAIAEAAIATDESRAAWIDFTIGDPECAIRFDGDRIEGCVMPQRR